MTASNALLVTIDSLRVDHLSSMGHDRATTPTIDALAADGLSFTEAIANGPSTRSSFPSILTSTYPLMYGGYTYLSDERPFVARVMSEAGYDTAAFHSNPHVGAPQNYDTGFDTFNDTAEGSDEVASLKDRVERVLDPDGVLYRILRRGYHMFTMATDSAAYARADTINENATDWLDEQTDTDDPFFLWVHYMDVHYPFQPPDEYMRKLDLEPLSNRRVADLNGRMHEDPESFDEQDHEDLLKLYDAEIRYTDDHVADLLDHLDTLGVRDDTAVVVCADHGEGFGEHDRYGHHPYLYDELLKVPFVVDAPDLDPDNLPDEDDTQVELLDIGATFYDLLALNAPDIVQGESVIEALNDDGERIAISASSGENVVAENVGEWKNFACRTTEWKCFWRIADGEVELYDLDADPGETRDVSTEHPEVVERLRGHIEDHIEEAEATELDLPDVEHAEEVEQRLRDLGYKT